jgi:KDO2-lipid IV(A) lauroyltransferase
MNQVIEEGVLLAPEQYMWLHRRVKTRPEGEPSRY